MALFLVPNAHEIPSGFEKRFEAFGMGPAAAVALARKLSLTKPNGPIIILGSAGGIQSGLKPGDCFLVRELYLDGAHQSLNIPQALSFLPQARLTSVSQPVTKTTEKIALGMKTQCELVDCEMEYFWNEISDDLKDRLLFIRGVLDPVSENLDFLKAYQIRWQSLVKPKNLIQFSRFVQNFFKYQKGMREFFIRVSDTLMLREESEITRFH